MERKLLLVASCIFFIVAVLLIIWSFVSQINFLEERYEEYITWLEELEYRIASIENIWLIILVILLMYLIRSFVPIYPVSILCVATAMVFSIPVSFAINILGMAILFAIKYALGTKTGGGKPQQLIRKSRLATNIIEKNGKGNSWALLVFRLVPGFPLNSVSRLYGAMKFPFWQYLLISSVGYLPKMASYIIIGRNVSNPFSLKFTIPLILLCIFSGLALMVMYSAWDAIDKVKDQEHEQTEESEESRDDEQLSGDDNVQTGEQNAENTKHVIKNT